MSGGWALSGTHVHVCPRPLPPLPPLCPPCGLHGSRPTRRQPAGAAHAGGGRPRRLCRRPLAGAPWACRWLWQGVEMGVLWPPAQRVPSKASRLDARACLAQPSPPPLRSAAPSPPPPSPAAARSRAASGSWCCWTTGCTAAWTTASASSMRASGTPWCLRVRQRGSREQGAAADGCHPALVCAGMWHPPGVCG